MFRLHARSRLVNPTIIHTPLFSLRIAHNTLTYNRYCFVVSKKVDMRAIARNRVRRMATTYIQSVMGTMQPGYDLLFHFHKPAVEQESKIAEEIEKVLAKYSLSKVEK